jgi:hypothetical protein
MNWACQIRRNADSQGYSFAAVLVVFVGASG